MPSPLGEPLDPATGFRTIRILHIVCVGSVLICGAVVILLLILEYEGPPRFPELSSLRVGFWFFAAGEFLWIWLIRVWRLRPEALRRSGTPTPSIVMWHVIMFACAASIVLYGFVLFFLTVWLADFLLFAALSLMVLFWLRPKEEDYYALVRQVRGQWE